MMIYRAIAFSIRKWPRLGNLIIQSAMKRPYYHLEGYMNRWWLTPRFLLTKDEEGFDVPYEWVPMWARVRVHHIFRPDNDRHLHDHPADNLSIVLKGYYDEQDIVGRSNIRAAGCLVRRRAECFHKIAYVPSNGVWTLWFMGEKRNDWGFLVNGRKVPWRTYAKWNHETKFGK